MKKLIIIIVVLTGIIWNAQAQFRYGVKGGMNISTLNFNRSDVDASSIVGYHAGLTSEYIFRKLGIGVELSALFSQRGVSYRSTDCQMYYVDIPLNFKWKYGLPFGSAFVTVGPYMGIAIGDKSNSFSVTGTTLRLTSEKYDAGLNAGVGVEIFKHFQVSAGYWHGIIDSHEVRTSGGQKSYAQSRNWAVSAAFLF